MGPSIYLNLHLQLEREAVGTIAVSDTSLKNKGLCAEIWGIFTDWANFKMSWSEAVNCREEAETLGLLVLAGEGLMSCSSIGRSKVREECGGVPRMGAVIGDDVRGDAVTS